MLLGVLDQCPVRDGGTQAEAVREAAALARVAESAGYHRYWVAEHHGSGGLASASPEILVGHLADVTSRIRVGTGGVMLTHYSPLKVAEQFRMLEALHPGRIDLGIGRAPGSDTRTARALAAGPGALGLDHYPDQVMDLYGYLADALPADHPFAGIRAVPVGENLPELWLLGSSAAGCRYAAELGWRFCFAQFIQPEGGERMLAHYRRTFRPSPFLDAPVASIAVSATCAETDEEAEYLSWSRWGWRVMGNRGPRAGIPTPEAAMTFEYTDAEREYLDYMRGNSNWGSPERVRDRIVETATRFDVGEVIVLTITHDPAARRRSYELLAKAFGLSTNQPSPWPG